MPLQHSRDLRHFGPQGPQNDHRALRQSRHLRQFGAFRREVSQLSQVNMGNTVLLPSELMASRVMSRHALNFPPNHASRSAAAPSATTADAACRGQPNRSLRNTAVRTVANMIEDPHERDLVLVAQAIE
jgi:hypothetical protein